MLKKEYFMSLAYSEMPLDRCTNQRKNKPWLAAVFNHADTLFCVVKDGMSYFNKTDEFLPYYLTKEQLTAQYSAALSIDTCIFLGKNDSGAFFSVDYDKLRFSMQESLDDKGQWQRLRQVTALLKQKDASILAFAKALVHWHKSHQFCGVCGHANRLVEAGHARKCTDCRQMTFPRTDPAVIMLVERLFDDGIARCLLGRQKSWPEGIYSTLAGFVDPGETLEEAVIREVLEETLIKVNAVQYITSQPWPFPASIMLGFTAQATTERIQVSQDDLETAKWFSRAELASFSIYKVSAQKQAEGFKMVSNDSISSHLLTAWKNKTIGIY